ncbi:hypothetical protein CASFOL_019089 [Castilleja foliolosa]|uniref:Pentatricopeptide repeat-containing protein n=1 Tax=Castilleja foliolosa TaxID=1961234 RepID=A0ABD3D776_9LAMI
MIDALCSNSMFDRAYDLIETMAKNKCPPNTVTFNVFIKGLCVKGKLDWAIELFDEMDNKHGCVPNVTTYNEVLDGFMFKEDKNSRRAFEFVSEMGKKGVRFNLVTYNTVIHGLCMCGKIEEVRRCLGRMIVEGIKPDQFTFNALVYGYAKNGMVEKGMAFHEDSSAHNNKSSDG